MLSILNEYTVIAPNSLADCYTLSKSGEVPLSCTFTRLDFVSYLHLV